MMADWVERDAGAAECGKLSRAETDGVSNHEMVIAEPQTWENGVIVRGIVLRCCIAPTGDEEGRGKESVGDCEMHS